LIFSAIFWHTPWFSEFEMIWFALLAVALGSQDSKWFGCLEDTLCIQAEMRTRKIPHVRARKSLRLEIFAWNLYMYFPEIDFEVSTKRLVNPVLRSGGYVYEMRSYHVFKYANLMEMLERINAAELSVFLSSESVTVFGVELWPIGSEKIDRVDTMRMLGHHRMESEEKEILQLSRLDLGYFARERDPKGFYAACKPGNWCMQVHVLSPSALEVAVSVVDGAGEVQSMTSPVMKYSYDPEESEMLYLWSTIRVFLHRCQRNGDLWKRLRDMYAESLFHLKGMRFFGIDLTWRASRMDVVKEIV